MKYNKEELDSFHSIYKAFDKQDTNEISKKDLAKIFETLQRDAKELDRIIVKLRIQNLNKISFDQFIEIMYELEKNFTS